MNKIIVATDYSASARNAMHFTFNMVHEKAHDRDIEIELVNIYTQPAAFSGEGMAIATLSDFLADAEEQMEEEVRWTKTNFPKLKISSRVVTGELHASLDDLVEELDPSLVVMGAAGDYNDLWSWGGEILAILRDLKAPVLVIPAHVPYAPIFNIGYACNYRNVSTKTPFKSVVDIVEFNNARLHVVYVDSPTHPGQKAVENGAAIINSHFSRINPEYTTLTNPKVIEAIAQFVKDKKIDLLLTTPQKYGIWDSIFHKSHTSSLARLNRLPILALREK